MKTDIKTLRKIIPELDLALHINKSNLEHIEFLENKIIELENKMKEEEVEYTCCGVEITQEIKDNDLCPKCLEHL